MHGFLESDTCLLSYRIHARLHGGYVCLHGHSQGYILTYRSHSFYIKCSDTIQYHTIHMPVDTCFLDPWIHVQLCHLSGRPAWICVPLYASRCLPAGRVYNRDCGRGLKGCPDGLPSPTHTHPPRPHLWNLT